MVHLPDSEKKFEDIFIRFDRMYERAGHTSHDGIGRPCMASRGENWVGGGGVGNDTTLL